MVHMGRRFNILCYFHKSILFGSNSSTVSCVLRVLEYLSPNATAYLRQLFTLSPLNIKWQPRPPHSSITLALHVNPFKFNAALVSIDLSVSATISESLPFFYPPLQS